MNVVSFIKALFSAHILKKVLSVFVFITAVVTTIFSFAAVYSIGSMRGFDLGFRQAESEYLAIVDEINNVFEQAVKATPTPSREPVNVGNATTNKIFWGGPDLWNAVNSRRQELGVNPLQQRDELCTIASIRLNELLDKNGLDGHEGFSNMQEERSDLVWIFEKYSTLAEFLAFGGKTAEETVSLWENTLGHKKLLTGGEYVWGCIYAQNTFAVAITAF